MNCIHPKECLAACGECEWCACIDRLTARCNALHEQLGKTCVRVDSGTVHLTCDAIGLLEVNGVSVMTGVVGLDTLGP